MARKAKEAGGNGVDRKLMKWAFSELDKIERELASERGTFRAHCRPIHERRRQIYDEADAKGATKAELRALFRAHRKAEEAKAVIAELEKDQRDRAAMMADVLGEDELPLFVFAAARSLRAPKKKSPPKLEVVPLAAE